MPLAPHRLWHPLLKAPEALLSLMDNSFSFFPFVLSHKEKLLLFQEEGAGQEGREGGTARRGFSCPGKPTPPRFQTRPAAGLGCCWYGNASLH